MKKRAFVTGMALMAVSTAALAADLPSRRAPPVYSPPPIPAAFSWTGFYIGANAGYAFDSRKSYTLDANDGVSAAALALGQASPFFRTRSGSGFTGGGQIGYNFAMPSFGGLGFGSGFLLGIEADAAYTDLRQGGDFIGGGFDTSYRSRTDYVGTVRGRLGYAFDTVLIYGTGGFAYGGVRDAIAINGLGGTQVAGARDAMRAGYAYGGGVEYALPVTSFLNVFNSSAVTLKAEFIHYDLGTRTMLVGPVVSPASFNSRVRTDGDLVRAGLNFKFGSVAPTPVVARY